MAKKLVKKAAAGPSKKAKPAPKSAGAKPSGRSVAPAKAKSAPAKSKSGTKPSAKSSGSKPVVATKKVDAKKAAVIKPAAKAVAVAARNGKPVATNTKPAPTNGKTSPANGKAVEIAKAPVKVEAAKAGKADPKAGKPVVAGAPIAIKIDPAKSGKPQLLQGPIAIRPMGKKATLPPTPPKPVAKPVKKRAPVSDEPKFVIVQPPTKAVATSEKAVKNKAGLNQKDLEFFRDLLLAKRRELLGDMNSMEREALRENSTDLSNLPVHMADQGTDAYEQEFTLHLVEKDRGLLRELNEALAKIQNGTYGICEGTGLPISKPRLEAQPWARYSIEHARVLEKRQMMFRR